MCNALVFSDTNGLWAARNQQFDAIIALCIADLAPDLSRAPMFDGKHGRKGAVTVWLRIRLWLVKCVTVNLMLAVKWLTGDAGGEAQRLPSFVQYRSS